MNSCRAAAAPPQLQPYTPEVRIVGKILDGKTPLFEAGEDPLKPYFIVTQAYVLYFFYLQGEVKELSLEVLKLRDIIERKK